MNKCLYLEEPRSRQGLERSKEINNKKGKKGKPKVASVIPLFRVNSVARQLLPSKDRVSKYTDTKTNTYPAYRNPSRYPNPIWTTKEAILSRISKHKYAYATSFDTKFKPGYEVSRMCMRPYLASTLISSWHVSTSDLRRCGQKLEKTLLTFL